MMEISWKWCIRNLVLCFYLEVTAAARFCCQDLYFIENSTTCLGNKINLQCQFGSFILQPSVRDDDKFSLISNETSLMLGNIEVKENEFCLGWIKKANSNIYDQVAVVCFSEKSDSDQSSIIHNILIVISIFFLLVTLYVYSVLPKLRDLQGKCVMAFIFSLTVSFMLFIGTRVPDTSDEICIIKAGLLYFFMSATFFWNNILTFNIWRSVRKTTSKLKDKTWALIFIFWGFGGPLLMVLVSFVLEQFPQGSHVRPHFGESRCWFLGKLETWSYFYGPISVLLILNIFMFLQSCWVLWKINRDSSLTKIRSQRFKCLMYLKLFLLTGITWVFEVISYAVENPNMKTLWFITDCLNSSQGIIIFLVLVVFRQKVRRGLHEKKVLNIKWPQSWGKEEILEESSTIALAEELELARQNTKFVNESHRNQIGNGCD